MDCLVSGPHGGAQDIATIGCIEMLFANIVSAATILVAIALFAMLVVGGYKYLTSGGDPKKLEESRGTLTYAAVGFVIVIAAFLIIAFIGAFVGLPELTIFRLLDVDSLRAENATP